MAVAYQGPRCCDDASTPRESSLLARAFREERNRAADATSSTTMTWPEAETPRFPHPLQSKQQILEIAHPNCDSRHRAPVLAEACSKALSFLAT
jgi:hypothetical protein